MRELDMRRLPHDLDDTDVAEWRNDCSAVARLTTIVDVARHTGERMLRGRLFCNAFEPTGYARLTNAMGSLIGQLNVNGFYTTDGDGFNKNKPFLLEGSKAEAYVSDRFQAELEALGRPVFVQFVQFAYVSGIVCKDRALKLARAIKEHGPDGISMGVGQSKPGSDTRVVVRDNIAWTNLHVGQTMNGFWSSDDKHPYMSVPSLTMKLDMLATEDWQRDNALLSPEAWKDAAENYVPVSFVASSPDIQLLKEVNRLLVDH